MSLKTTTFAENAPLAIQSGRENGPPKDDTLLTKTVQQKKKEPKGS